MLPGADMVTSPPWLLFPVALVLIRRVLMLPRVLDKVTLPPMLPLPVLLVFILPATLMLPGADNITGPPLPLPLLEVSMFPTAIVPGDDRPLDDEKRVPPT
jgi:hypothetical protein